VSETLTRVQNLAARGVVRVSDHGYDELAADGILITELLSSLPEAIAVEDYPDAFKGPSVLVLQTDSRGAPVHVLWAIPAGHDEPAVLVTAYRPDSTRWSADYTKRNVEWKR
jgi:hypothetical protein